MDKIRCRLCEKEYEDKEMSDEHYPAHSVGNDDIVQLNIVKLFDVMMGENSDCRVSGIKHFGQEDIMWKQSVISQTRRYRSI